MARRHSNVRMPIQVGVVVNKDEHVFSVKWTSYNKDFFMEKTEDMFHDLNKTFLLRVEEFQQSEVHPFLVLLNSNYMYEERRQKIRRSNRDDCQAIQWTSRRK